MNLLNSLLAGLLALALSAPVEAATKYIKPNGSDALDGSSPTNAYKTWSKAFASTTCGDTLIVEDGTYGSANIPTTLTKSCTASAPYIVTAHNERQAFIDASSGTFLAFKIQSSTYIEVHGLHLKSGDLSLANGAANGGILNVYNSSHITITRTLVEHTNRYLNAGHGIQAVAVTFSTFEENEILWFHRHGLYIGSNSNDNFARRNVCNGMGYADLSGSGVENPSVGPATDHADDCVLIYPGSRDTLENNIAIGDMLKCFASEASGVSVGNKYLGNICVGGAWNGFALDARLPTSSTNMPKDTTIENNVVIGTTNHGISGQTATSYRFNATKNTILRNNTAIDTTGGFEFDRLSGVPGDGIYSATLENNLALRVTGYGFRISSLYTWAATDNDGYLNTLGNYNPTTSVNYSPNPQAAVDPGMGPCYLWAPDGSYAATNNIGARILYKYFEGVLTQERLWDQTTGEFPHGAVITGVNDTGVQASTVHTTLRVNTGGCTFPSGYIDLGSGPTDPAAHQVFTGDITAPISGTITIPSGLRYLALFALLRDSGANVGTLSSISIDCGSKSLTFGARGRSNSSAGYHDMEGWIVQNPTSGTCVFTAVASGAWNTWIFDFFGLTTGTSITWHSNGAAGVAGTATTDTISSATGDIVYNAVSGTTAYTLVQGAGQSLLVDQASGPVRMAVSSKTGAASVSSTWAFGGPTLWGTVSLNVHEQTSQPPSKPTGLNAIRR